MIKHKLLLYSPILMGILGMALVLLFHNYWWVVVAGVVCIVYASIVKITDGEQLVEDLSELE